nr:uncharacterized protein LOC117691065 [Crassostrea gigas]XP_034332407.1 uncharacterized protein LOC105332054 [Crassostrea gigas]
MWEENFRQFLKNRSDSELSDSSSNISLPSLEEFSTCANDEDAPISISSTDSFKETKSFHLSSQDDSIVILSSPESVSNSPTSKAYQDLSDSSSSSGHDFDQRSFGHQTKSSDQPLEYFEDNKHMPIYSSSDKGFSVKDAVSIIINTKDKLASKVPFSCKETKIFVVDTSKLEHIDDIRSHELGAMKNERVQRD